MGVYLRMVKVVSYFEYHIEDQTAFDADINGSNIEKNLSCELGRVRRQLASNNKLRAVLKRLTGTSRDLEIRLARLENEVERLAKEQREIVSDKDAFWLDF